MNLLKAINEQEIIPKNINMIVKRYHNASNINQKNYEININGPKFELYDGPPFPNSGIAHFGHLAISTFKSCIQRFKIMTDHNVMNTIGFDCHGLPIEMAVNKLLGINFNHEIHELGLDKYNKKCKDTINDNIKSWHNIFECFGRPINPQDQYTTMDPKYMESIWWVFKELNKKGYVYNGHKIMPYSWKCTTCLSNFEAGQNYKDVIDPTVYVVFPLITDPNTKFIVWTTTPWTLPSNVALCVNANMDYLKISINGYNGYYIILESCVNDLIDNLFPKSKKKNNSQNSDKYQIIDKISGKDLVGLKYMSIFDYFQNNENLYQVIADNYVRDGSGTGIVHIAPGFGEDDFRVSIANDIVTMDDIEQYCPIDENGCFTDTIHDYIGQNVFDANKAIITDIKHRGRMILRKDYKHSYPFCWRTDTRLIYKLMPSIFVKVTEIKDDLIKNNNKMTWTPRNIKKRFDNWLKDARDWCVSRSRFFGTPIPIWISDNCEEMVCIGSIEELIELAGLDKNTKITDLHPEFINNITIPSQNGNGDLHRIPDVFDCWFESGCMPYAQMHYPFENSGHFDDKEYLCDVICEGLDQTRGWFYTLLVLSTALFDKPPAKNIICTGLVLDEKGQKFSKKLGNYKNPHELFDTYGVDVLRLYLLGSPVGHGDSFRFKEKDLDNIKRKVHQFSNAVNYLIGELIFFEKNGGIFDKDIYTTSDNITDKWILSRISSLTIDIMANMDDYKFHHIPNQLLSFIEDLVNWYIKFNKERTKGKNVTQHEQCIALSVLNKVSIDFIKLMAPFAPFITEYNYHILMQFNNNIPESVHLNRLDVDDSMIDMSIEDKMRNLQKISIMVRALRSRNNNITSVKIPIKSVTLFESNDFINNIREIENYFKNENNIINVIYKPYDNNIRYIATPDNKNIGMKFKKLSSTVKKSLKNIDQSLLVRFKEDNCQELVLAITDPNGNKQDIILSKDDFVINIELDNMGLDNYNNSTMIQRDNSIIAIDDTYDYEVKNIHISRLFSSTIQQMRKSTSLKPWDKIKIQYKILSNNLDDKLKLKLTELNDILNNNYDFIVNIINYDFMCIGNDVDSDNIIVSDNLKLNDIDIMIIISSCE